MITVFTIGFTKKTAKEFFTKLKDTSVRQLIDVRLNNQSQLAGFTKRDDLAYFLKAIAGIEYIHLSYLAPTKVILDSYKKGTTEWASYEKAFRALVKERQIEKQMTRELLDKSCLLCSEAEPTHCHRRLVAEYLKEKWDDLDIQHIL